MEKGKNFFDTIDIFLEVTLNCAFMQVVFMHRVFFFFFLILSTFGLIERTKRIRRESLGQNWREVKEINGDDRRIFSGSEESFLFSDDA